MQKTLQLHYVRHANGRNEGLCNCLFCARATRGEIESKVTSSMS